MIKVFLVEDEFIIREGIKNKISWEQEGLLFAGEASDGELAYPLIKKERPDILITDIRMPFMDGLELSRLVKQELPDIKIIILSGYGEFDYAKKAINIGVTDYLLKPITSAELLNVIRKVAEVIEQERTQSQLLERYQKEMQENTEREQQKLLSLILGGSISTSEAIEEGKNLGIDLMAPCLAVILFKFYSAEENPLRYCEDVVRAEEEVCKAIMSGDILMLDRAEYARLLLIKGENEEEIAGKIEKITGQIQKIHSRFPQLFYFGGSGEVVHRLRDLGKSYGKASRAFACRFFAEKNQILDSSTMHESNAGHADKIDIENIDFKMIDAGKAGNFLKDGTCEEIEHFVSEYFMGIGEANYRSMMFRQYVAIDLYFCGAELMKELGMDMSMLSEQFRQVHDIAGYVEDMEKLKAYISGMFHEVMKVRDGCSQKKYTEMIKKAKFYIEENFNTEDISLNHVSAYVNISPCYFSNIFSQETGQTFIEYLTQVRMKHAKELLRCTNKRSSEIAEEVGYQDAHYFSFLFKKTQGITPSDYRKQKGTDR